MTDANGIERTDVLELRSRLRELRLCLRDLGLEVGDGCAEGVLHVLRVDG